MIEIQGLTKTHGDTIVLDNLSLTLPDHGLVCVIGPSGCGKTTLANIVAGLDRSYSGTVRVNGTDLKPLSPRELDRWRAANIGFVFQDFHLLDGVSALENILVSEGLHRSASFDSQVRAIELLKRFGLNEAINRNVETLSGGEQQRVAIARALMWGAPVVVADEPTGSLDSDNARAVMSALKRISCNHLVLMVTHDNNLLSHADMVVRIENGKAEIQRSDAARIAPQTVSAPFSEGLQQRAQKLWTGSGGIASTVKNHLGRYIPLVMLFACCGMLVCAALAAQSAIERAIVDFENANVGFASGFIDGKPSAEILKKLQSDPRIATVWEQKPFGPIEISIEDASTVLEQKVPLPRANEALSFGSMPRRNKEEIALSPSLARKFGANISSLVGSTAHVRIGNTELTLKVSGIYNAGYDDIFLSSDIEQRLCAQAKGDSTAVSFEVKQLADIPKLHRELNADGAMVTDATEKISATLDSFKQLRTTFSIVSAAVAAISLGAGIALTTRVQKGRTAEFGLRRALGFTRGEVLGICRRESLVVGAAAAGLCALGGNALSFIPFAGSTLNPSETHIILCAIGVGIAALLAFELATRIALTSNPAQALSAD